MFNFSVAIRVKGSQVSPVTVGHTVLGADNYADARTQALQTYARQGFEVHSIVTQH